MAVTEGPTSGPDLQSLIRASMPQQSGSGVAPILMGLRLDCNVSQALAAQSCAVVKFDGKMQFGNPPREGLLGKIWKDIKGEGLIPGLQKCAQAGAPAQCSITDITGQSHGLGGGVPIGPSGGYDGPGG